MATIIDHPSAGTILALVRQLPIEEQRRLRELLDAELVAPVDESTTWSDEDLSDLDRATARLIDARYGAEAGHYD